MADTKPEVPGTRPPTSGSITRAMREVRLPMFNDVIGNLTVQELVAAGGMADIYKAYHRELEVPRAIKLLKPGFSRENRERFQTEAKLSANLHHPNIVQIYNVGLWQEILPFIEMEYVDGLSLHELIADRGRIPVIVAAAIGRIVCDALEFANNSTFTVYGNTYQGLVHRDIKPANILISHKGIVKLADFGIALPGSVSLHTTEPGMLGTFPYSSPEQIQSDKLDCRTDIYSLGMVLYECFCGEKAFPQKALPELIDRKMTGRFIDIRQVVHGIPEEFAQIIDSSTILQRDRRFPDEKALIAALDAVIARHSSLSSAQIVENYITRQEAVEIAAASDAVKKPSGSRFLFLYLLAACAIIIAMAGIVWFTDRSNTAKRAKTADGPHYDQPVRRTATPAVSQAPDPVAPAARQQPRSGARPVRTDLLQEGMRAFSAGDYALAAGCLEQADTTVLDQRMRRIVRLRLIESYLGSGGTGKAGALAAAGPLDDGYFHLLKGRMHLESGRLDMAEESLVAAQTTRSVMGPVTRRDAVFYWARTIYERYRRKPNSENKTRAFTAWTNFQQAFCGVSADERQCAEAAERIAALSR